MYIEEINYYILNEPRQEVSKNVVCATSRLRSVEQSDQSLCLLLEYFVTVKLLTEHQLESLSLTGGCTGSSESTHVKMPHCWKSHVAAQFALVCTSYMFHPKNLYLKKKRRGSCNCLHPSVRLPVRPCYRYRLRAFLVLW